jgi:hypothetical protein
LYNLPLIPEEEDDEEIENTSFYSNILYSTGEDDEDDFVEAKSTLESKLETTLSTASSSTASASGPFAANERPPLVSAVNDTSPSASITEGENSDSKNSQVQDGGAEGGEQKKKDKDKEKDAYPTPSLPCVSTATNSVHIVGEMLGGMVTESTLVIIKYLSRNTYTA